MSTDESPPASPVLVLALHEDEDSKLDNGDDTMAAELLALPSAADEIAATVAARLADSLSEFRTAMTDLETWKKRQQEEFDAQLRAASSDAAPQVLDQLGEDSDDADALPARTEV